MVLDGEEHVAVGIFLEEGFVGICMGADEVCRLTNERVADSVEEGGQAVRKGKLPKQQCSIQASASNSTWSDKLGTGDSEHGAVLQSGRVVLGAILRQVVLGLVVAIQGDFAQGLGHRHLVLVIVGGHRVSRLGGWERAAAGSAGGWLAAREYKSSDECRPRP